MMIEKDNDFSQLILNFATLSDLDFEIIDYIGIADKITLKDIVAELEHPRSTISYRIKLLEQEGILLRAPVVTKEKPIVLTSKGEFIFENNIFGMELNSSIRALDHVFAQISDLDKDFVQNKLHILTLSRNNQLRRKLAYMIGSAFPHIFDRDAAWSDLHRLTQDEDRGVRRNAAGALGSCFSHVPVKGAAWSDLHRLTRDKDRGVRRNAAGALGLVFSHVPDKDAAWSGLHRLAQDEDGGVRGDAAGALGLVFSHVPDKDAAWSDLHRLAQDEDGGVRGDAAGALGLVFSHVPDKDAAWSDLLWLTQDEDGGVRGDAAGALGLVFSHVPDKDAAWSDLLRLTQDEDSYVRMNAARALGSCFSAVPDKNTAWSDLIWLTQDEGSDVRMYAYHSLGIASVYKATEAGGEGKFRDELKKAIEYFEKSSREARGNHNPARFCLPFYSLYYAVISEKREVEAEAAKYLDEAKKATGGSESREALLKAVENLAYALKEAQEPLDFSKEQEHLRACRQYCDHTAELVDSARGKSPVAAAVIMRGMPIVKVKAKEIIAEIQEKAKEACRQMQGTPTEKIACAVNQEVQKWVISDQEEMTQKVDNLVFCLKSKIPDNFQNKHIHEKIDEIRGECNMTKQYEMVSLLIALIPMAVTSDVTDVMDACEKIPKAAKSSKEKSTRKDL